MNSSLANSPLTGMLLAAMLLATQALHHCISSDNLLFT